MHWYHALAAALAVVGTIQLVQSIAQMRALNVHPFATRRMWRWWWADLMLCIVLMGAAAGLV